MCEKENEEKRRVTRREIAMSASNTAKQTAIISTVPSLLYSRVWGWKIIRIITRPMVVDKVVCVVNPLWVSVSHRCAATYLFLVSPFPFSHSTHFLPLFLQMIIDIIHPGRANVSKSELQEVVGGMYKADAKLTVIFGLRTKFGGGRSTGFCLVYDNEEAIRKFEPKHRLVRNGFEERKEKSRKAIKEAKNKGKKIRGTGASIAKHKAKRAALNE